MIEILEMRILSPAKVKLIRDGIVSDEMVSVDLVNRQTFQDGKLVEWSDQLFEYLDSVTILPEDFFQASDEDYETMARVQAEHEQMMQGGYDVGSPTD